MVKASPFMGGAVSLAVPPAAARRDAVSAAGEERDSSEMSLFMGDDVPLCGMGAGLTQVNARRRG